MMRRRKSGRKPHPDPRTELELQRILAAQAVIARMETMITDYRKEIASARNEQDKAGSNLRGTRASDSERRGYEIQSRVQRDRIITAATRITEAETSIAAAHDRVAELASKLSDTDLSYLGAS